jgi:hypothetical protein
VAAPQGDGSSQLSKKLRSFRALGLLPFGFIVTFGSTAMGSAIMAMGEFKRGDDGHGRRGPATQARDRDLRRQWW